MTLAVRPVVSKVSYKRVREVALNPSFAPYGEVGPLRAKCGVVAMAGVVRLAGAHPTDHQGTGSGAPLNGSHRGSVRGALPVTLANAWPTRGRATTPTGAQRRAAREGRPRRSRKVSRSVEQRREAPGSVLRHLGDGSARTARRRFARPSWGYWPTSGPHEDRTLRRHRRGFGPRCVACGAASIRDFTYETSFL
jgi:hypothetical protein